MTTCTESDSFRLKLHILTSELIDKRLACPETATRPGSAAYCAALCLKTFKGAFTSITRSKLNIVATRAADVSLIICQFVTICLLLNLKFIMLFTTLLSAYDPKATLKFPIAHVRVNSSQFSFTALLFRYMFCFPIIAKLSLFIPRR